MRTFLQIVTPLSKPILAVITLFYASGHWNSYMSSMLYLSDRAKFPLQLILREMLINEETLGLTATDGGSQFVLYTITLNSSAARRVPVRSEVLCQGRHDRRD